MSLPRFALQEDDDDSTAPAQFLLKLPPSYAQRLASLAPSTPGEWMIPAPFPTQAPAKARRDSRHVIAMIAGGCVALAIMVGVGGALAQSSEGPVGISKRAPKKLEHVLMGSTRQSGAAAHVHVPTVPVESLQHHRKRGRH